MSKDGISADGLELAYSMAPNGIAVYSFDGEKIRVVCASEKYFKIFMYTRDEYVSIPANSYGIRMLDEVTGKTLIQELKEALSKSTGFATNLHVTLRNGAAATINYAVNAVKNDDGTFTLYCSVLDISRYSMSDSMENSDEYRRMCAISSISADVIFEYDFSDNSFSIFRNDNGEYIKDATIPDFESFYKENKLFHEDDTEAFERFCDMLQIGNEKYSGEIRFYNENSEEYEWNRIRFKTIVDLQTGLPMKAIGEFVNISEKKDAEQKLIDKAERDPLTKIYNKATTRSMIKNFLRTDNRESYDALIIVDVDNFKHVNDSLGHLFGDSILVDLSQEMQDLFRSNDVVGRIGGDEFVVFLRGIKQKKHIADKAGDICKIFDLLYSGDDGEKITGSLGIALFPQDGDTYDDLFKKADIALYTSKSSGKNCYTFYDEEKTDEMPEPVPRRTHANRYSRDAILSLGNDPLELEITGLAFDVMDTTKNVGGAVSMILSKIGKRFSLNRVSIIEQASDDDNKYKYTYQWCSRSLASQLGDTVTVTAAEKATAETLFDKNDIAVYSMEDAAGVCAKTALTAIYVKSALYCNMYDGERYIGTISFHDCANDRMWSVDEVNAIKIIAKVVQSYLFKIRELERAVHTVETLSNYDSMTGLPSYKKFCEAAKETVQAGFENDSYAIICTDILNFEYINDKYGVDNGDKLLRAFGSKLTDACDGFKIACRVIADRFLIFAKIETLDTLKRSLNSFAESFSVKDAIGVDDTITIIMGIALIGSRDYFNINMSVSNASVAVKHAKKSNTPGAIIYNDEMRVEMTLAEKTRREAEAALENGEFAVYMQPKVGLSSGKIVGAEALVRWIKPDGVTLLPSDFLKYLESSGFIVKLDYYVYDKVCTYLRERLDEGKEVVPVSVNVSGIHLKTPDFVDNVLGIVRKYSIPKNLLEFELTENVFVENEENALAAMTRLRKLGFTISIDDFGSGFSSLNLLKNLPVDNLKIDKEFFSNDVLKNNDKIIIAGIIAMANRMNISIVCEGVETQEQVDFLRDNNCDMVQGFFYAKPVPSKDFEEISIEDK